jgi:hypothetical protein
MRISYFTIYDCLLLLCSSSSHCAAPFNPQ